MIRITKNFSKKAKEMRGSVYVWTVVIVILVALLLFFLAPQVIGKVSYKSGEKIPETANAVDAQGQALTDTTAKEATPVLPPLDEGDYNRRMLLLANNPPQPQPTTKKVKGADGKITEVVVPAAVRHDKWPVDTVYPLPGAILPFKRVIAYYGNLYSTKMGVLGQYPEDTMLAKLNAEVAKWNSADPSTPAIPALHYIVSVAQGSAGKDGKFRFRMPESEIDKVIAMADKVHGIVFLDVQVALSNVQTEVPLLKKYLEMPNVHLGIDPEFSMKTGAKPGTVVGTMDGDVDVNFAVNYLSKIVKDNNLPPKILIVHRYTKKMLTNSAKIKPTPEVQVVINMDGWGGKTKKIGTYKNFIFPEPVQFAGFKLFYKNDVIESGTKVFEPSELLKLTPRPIYIQYQ